MITALRADASLRIGSGHVMRCLSIAQTLRAEGVQCHFICREQEGDLIGRLRELDFPTHCLEQVTLGATAGGGWLGASETADADGCLAILRQLRPDWLIADNYGIGTMWETAVSPHCGRLMVIDDLADRHHECDVLLDQNLGRTRDSYTALVPATCTILAGPQYAMLAPEFAQLRASSLERRKSGELRHILISMGGVDLNNATGAVLDALTNLPLPLECSFSVVLGRHAPWKDEVWQAARRLRWQTEVLVDVRDMAKRLCNADLVIGAPGGSSWERCCLGVPTIMMVIAENQISGAAALEAAGAAMLVGSGETLAADLASAFAITTEPARLRMLSRASAAVTDGLGLSRIKRVLVS